MCARGSWRRWVKPSFYNSFVWARRIYVYVGGLWALAE